jgi:hypothetical protein
MNKEEWIEAWTSGKWKSTRREVIEFIANVLYHNSIDNSSIYQLFACGYCYYFAVILKDAFKRGEVCWHKGYSHIVWVDDDDTAYDIGGVFYDYGEGDLIPLSEAGIDISGFKKTPY